MARWSTNKEMNRIITDAEQRGWMVEFTKNNHIKLLPPGGGAPVFVSGTPGDGRAIKNAEAMIRRAERQLGLVSWMVLLAPA